MALDKEEARQRADKLLQDASQESQRKSNRLQRLRVPIIYQTSAIKAFPLAAQVAMIEEAIDYINEHTVFSYLKYLYLLSAMIACGHILSSDTPTLKGLFYAKIIVVVIAIVSFFRWLKIRAYIDQVVLPNYL